MDHKKVMETGSSEDIINLLSTVISTADDGSAIDDESRLWKLRVNQMIKCVIESLVYMRDNNKLYLSLNVIKKNISLKNVISLSHNEKVPDSIRFPIKSYLESLPGFEQSKGQKQSLITLEQHSYLEMQFSLKFLSL